MSRSSHRPAAWALVLGGLACSVLAGCDRASSGLPFALQHRPTVELTVAPAKGDSTSYAVHLEWRGADADGQVVGYQYAVDPPAMPTPGNDTLWVDTGATHADLVLAATRPPEILPPPGQPVPASDYHTVVVRAIDDDGRRSAPVARSFTAFTVAPFTVITSPDPTDQLAIGTPPTFVLRWTGTDPDGPPPVQYKIRVARAEEIDPHDPTSITAGEIQAFFGADGPTFHAAGWDSVSGDSSARVLRDLVPGVLHFVALVAVDASGAHEPRFDRNGNVLAFIPTLDVLGPRIRVFNAYFDRTQVVPGISLDPARVFRLEIPSGIPFTVNWAPLQGQPGVFPTETRWALDIVDIFDETPRSGPDDLAHWSAWSLTERSVTVGPFPPPPPDSVGSPERHVLSIQARDELGNVSMMQVAFTVIAVSLDRDLLIVDDLYGAPTQLQVPASFPGEIRIAGAYPMEAEQDSFYVARGGFPDSLAIRSGTPGAISLAGAFADYDADTLDYRFWPNDGIDLGTLSRYRAVCWYTDLSSAARSGTKFGSVSPMTALRALNSINRVNTLALYLRQGGKAWLFGEGATAAIAHGWWSRVGGTPRLPYTGDDVLVPGNFLHDFVHLRSELTTGGGPTFPATQLESCIPFLPAFFPDEPGAARTAVKWPDLPRLTIAAYRGAPADPALSSTFVVHAPNGIAGLDTLYIHEARQSDPSHVYAPNDADGYPNAVHYHGPDNGPGSQLVWFGFPLHYFERDQVRGVAAAVMRNFGIAPSPRLATRRAPRT